MAGSLGSAAERRPPSRPTPTMACGAVAERTIAPVLKTGDRKVRGFESLPLRQTLWDTQRSYRFLGAALEHHLSDEPAGGLAEGLPQARCGPGGSVPSRVVRFKPLASAPSRASRRCDQGLGTSVRTAETHIQRAVACLACTVAPPDPSSLSMAERDPTLAQDVLHRLPETQVDADRQRRQHLGQPHRSPGVLHVHQRRLRLPPRWCP